MDNPAPTLSEMGSAANKLKNAVQQNGEEEDRPRKKRKLDDKVNQLNSLSNHMIHKNIPISDYQSEGVLNLVLLQALIDLLINYN